MATEEELFDKAVPVKLKSNDRDERFGALHTVMFVL